MRKRKPQKNKPRLGYDDTIAQVNELGDALNTFSLALHGDITEDRLKALIQKKLGSSIYPQSRKIGYQLVASNDPVALINALRQKLHSALK